MTQTQASDERALLNVTAASVVSTKESKLSAKKTFLSFFGAQTFHDEYLELDLNKFL